MGCRSRINSEEAARDREPAPDGDDSDSEYSQYSLDFTDDEIVFDDSDDDGELNIPPIIEREDMGGDGETSSTSFNSGGDGGGACGGGDGDGCSSPLDKPSLDGSPPSDERLPPGVFARGMRTAAIPAHTQHGSSLWPTFPGFRIPPFQSNAATESQRPQHRTPRCKFCVQNGEEDVFHFFKDEDGHVLCPVLSAYTCKLCGATGTRAHTLKYCPENRLTLGDPVAAGMPPGLMPAFITLEHLRK
ncbi:hypothetical protein O3P69_019473 [Scylla paramamosain]|uniref:Nanos-type domain-containing protein n=1 Tax=Scylla paramamosain TaxID=85552 RepID=A0AAW0SW15_SCYPA